MDQIGKDLFLQAFKLFPDASSRRSVLRDRGARSAPPADAYQISTLAWTDPPQFETEAVAGDRRFELVGR
jgi:hypothetical protein